MINIHHPRVKYPPNTSATPVTLGFLDQPIKDEDNVLVGDIRVIAYVVTNPDLNIGAHIHSVEIVHMDLSIIADDGDVVRVIEDEDEAERLITGDLISLTHESLWG